MNWKTKIVLLFARLRKPIAVDGEVDVAQLRKKANRATRLGSFLFDRKLPVDFVKDEYADGVPVRIYKNGKVEGQRVIVYYHGGGFVLYGRYSHDYVCRRLCTTTDCVVVSVDYRLAPEYTYPVAHDDAYSALLWVKRNASSFGGNADDVVVAGDSAGGNLSACIAHRCRKNGVSLSAQVLIYPWVDGKLSNPSIERNGKGFLLEKETVFWFRQQYTPRPEDRCAPGVSPCYEEEFKGLAPAFVITAELDPLLDDGRNYFKQLSESGVKTSYKEYKGLFHGFFNTPGVHSTARQSYQDIADFLKTV